MIKQKIISLFNKIIAIGNLRQILIFILCFDALFVFINIYKSNFLIGCIFLLFNILFILISKTSKNLMLIYFLYPFSRVLKLPNFGTSFLTILICVFVLKQITFLFLNKPKIASTSKIVGLFLFVAFFIYSLGLSIINFKGFALKDLFSYYLYLFFPVITIVNSNNNPTKENTTNLILLSLSFLVGMLTTMFFFYIVPQGKEMLESSGVIVFEMGLAGTRLSPLTDDPNYGTALIILISCLFICSKKTRLQKKIGYTIMIFNLILNILSLSKMYIICLFVIVLFAIATIVIKNKSILIASFATLGIFLIIFIFINTNIGQSLLIRIIGTNSDGFNINQITSGRAELFQEYTSYFIKNPLVLLFGKGPLFQDLSLFTAGEHNTFSKMIFSLGLVGVTLLIFTFYILIKNIFVSKDSLLRNTFFIIFIACLTICCSSLCLTPSTVGPIVILSFSFTDFSKLKSNIFKSHLEGESINTMFVEI